MTRRAALEETGVEVYEPELWDAGQHLVEWFWRMDSTRSAGMGGALPLLPTDIEAWCRLTGTETTPWEASALFAMDRARLRGPEEAVVHQEPASQAINTAVFDAMFG